MRSGGTVRSLVLNITWPRATDARATLTGSLPDMLAHASNTVMVLGLSLMTGVQKTGVSVPTGGVTDCVRKPWLSKRHGWAAYWDSARRFLGPPDSRRDGSPERAIP